MKPPASGLYLISTLSLYRQVISSEVMRSHTHHQKFRSVGGQDIGLEWPYVQPWAALHLGKDECLIKSNRTLSAASDVNDMHKCRKHRSSHFLSLQFISAENGDTHIVPRRRRMRFRCGSVPAVSAMTDSARQINQRGQISFGVIWWLNVSLPAQHQNKSFSYI